MSPKTTKIVISGPFDARHVGGVSIPGVNNPVPGIQRSFTSIQPDTVPTHSFAATGNEEVTKPKRANSLASSFTRPSLRLKTSISRLRARSSSNSPDTTYRKKDGGLREEDKENAERGDMSTASLRKKPSSSRLRERARSNPADHSRRHRDYDHEASIPETAEKPTPTEKSLPPLRLRSSTSTSRFAVKTTLVDLPDHSHHHRQPPPQPLSQIHPSRPLPPRTPPKPSQPATRPKRADSGTAIDFSGAPAEERPLGFKEIIAINSFEKRMALYKRTREYWASADHGLEEWVVKAGTGGRRMVSMA